jgi:hypothetical protein
MEHTRETWRTLATAAHAQLDVMQARRLQRVIDYGPIRRQWDAAEDRLIELGLIEPYPRDADTHCADWRADPDDRPSVIAAELGSWWAAFSAER